MNNMFKTTLVAAAITVAMNASAGTVNITKQTHSIEGLAGVTAQQTSSAITYDLGAGYLVGDKITFTFPAGSIVAGSYPTTLSVPSVDTASASTAIAGLALGLVDSTANSVTYRVLSVEQPLDTGNSVSFTSQTTLGATISLGSIGYTSASVLNASVTVTVSSTDAAGNAIDTSGTTTGTIAEAKTQFGSATANGVFNNIIDVSSDRKSFTPSAPDVLGYTITNPATTGWINLATVDATGGTSVTLYGENLAGLTAAAFSTSGTKVFTENANSLAVTYNGMVTNDTITFTAPGNVVLEPQTFATDIIYNYSSASSVAGTAIISTALNSGAWTLNGAMVNVPYMPYGSGISQILYVTNEGNQVGDILVTAIDDAGNEYDLGVIASAGANKVTKITSQVKDALAAEGFTSGKVSLTITVNAPSDAITVYASYNAGAVRGYVNTDQYKGQ